MWSITVRSKFDGFDEDVELKTDYRQEFSPLIWRGGLPWKEIEENDPKLFWKAYDPMSSKWSNFSYLTPEEFRKVYTAMKAAHAHFISGEEPLNYYAGNAKVYEKQRYYFDKLMDMLDSDPRLQDPPPDLPKIPEEFIRTREEEAEFEESMKELFAKIERRRERAEATYGKRQEK